MRAFYMMYYISKQGHCIQVGFLIGVYIEDFTLDAIELFYRQ